MRAGQTGGVHKLWEITSHGAEFLTLLESYVLRIKCLLGAYVLAFSCVFLFVLVLAFCTFCSVDGIGQ